MFRNSSRFLFSAFFAVGFAVLLPLLLPARAPGDSATAEQKWSDTSRDIYVDGELDPSIVSLIGDVEEGPAPLALWSESLGSAYVVDGESLEVHRLPLTDFAFDGSGATTRKTSDPVAVARAVRIGKGSSAVHMVNLDDRTLVVALHQGLPGPTPLDDLFHAVPTWQRRAQAYAPDDEAVQALRSNEREIEVTVALGTWCGDSRNYVPKLLKSLEEAGNPKIRLDLMAIQRGFTQPSEFIREEQVTNVPTVIVREAGVEIGRIVETPGSETVEADLAAILDHRAVPHPGRWQRGAEVAHGRYTYRDDDEQPMGSETWELYETEEAGRLLHSIVSTEDSEVEIWHRTSAAGVSEFAELTRRRGDELSRTRLWLDDGNLRSLTRGNATGIVDQKMEVPIETRFLLPSAAAIGQSEAPLAGAGDGSAGPRFLLPLEQPTAGKLVQMQASASDLETIATGLGEVSARLLTASYDRVEARWWLDDETGMPVRGSVPDLGHVTLETLQTSALEGAVAR